MRGSLRYVFFGFRGSFREVRWVRYVFYLFVFIFYFVLRLGGLFLWFCYLGVFVFGFFVGVVLKGWMRGWGFFFSCCGRVGIGIR